MLPTDFPTIFEQSSPLGFLVRCLVVVEERGAERYGPVGVRNHGDSMANLGAWARMGL